MVDDEDAWALEQRRRRRLWTDSVELFKKELDWALGDPDGFESTLVPIQAKKGKKRWVWTNRKAKGAIEFQAPDGEVFIRGNADQQYFFLEILRQFTKEWEGELPNPKSRRAKKAKSGKGKSEDDKVGDELDPGGEAFSRASSESSNDNRRTVTNKSSHPSGSPPYGLCSQQQQHLQQEHPWDYRFGVA